MLILSSLLLIELDHLNCSSSLIFTFTWVKAVVVLGSTWLDAFFLAAVVVLGAHLLNAFFLAAVLVG